MIPITRYLRVHIWVVIGCGILSAGFMLWVFGMESAATVVGWGVALSWTCALLLEGAAFGAGRWFAGRTVSRSFYLASLALLVFLFLLHIVGGYMYSSLIIGEKWYQVAKPVYIEMFFGGGYEHYGAWAILLLLQWALLVGCMTAILRLFRSGKPTGSRVRKGVLTLLVLLTFSCSYPVLSLMNDLMKVLRDPVDVPFLADMRLVQLTSEMSMVLLLGAFCIQLWLLAAWVPRAEIQKILLVLFVVVLLWAAPFLYGFLRYGIRFSHLVSMGHIYTAATLCVPLVSWVIFILAGGRRGSRM